MFRIHESSEVREQNIRRRAQTEPRQAFLHATVHMEWCIRRACIALGNEPNVIIKSRLQRASGLSRLSGEWDRIPSVTPLEELLGRNTWLQLLRVFNLRNRIVHGNGGASRAYANQMMDVAFYVASCVRQYAQGRGVDLHRRLQVRQRPTGNGTIRGHAFHPDNSLKHLLVEEDEGRRFSCAVDRLST